MPKSKGLYEVLITQLVEEELKSLDSRLSAKRAELRPAEAADRIALHVARLIRRTVESKGELEKATFGVHLAQALVRELAALSSNRELPQEAPIDPGVVLQSIVGRNPDGSEEELSPPFIPLLDTTLLTNSPGEPRVGSQILTEIHSADRIDVVMAFIRRSGIAPLLEPLRRFCASGRTLRVLTTVYTGSTEAAALDALKALGAEIRVSYDTTTTRLHAKAWLFHRSSGFSTAYIGSSNLTHSAQVSGLEWNVRISGARNPDVIEKVEAVFETYWSSGDFAEYEAEKFAAAIARRSSGPELAISPIELRPEPFQERLLEQIAVARSRGHTRNLLVSATGTGKTVMAALDYARLRQELPRSRLLFVAHRQEILEKSLATFRHALREHAFGELWVNGKRPRQFEHVFASIQSIAATGLDDFDPEHFDVVIVDEFHHAAAPSYAALLEHLRPRQLLGLTATPERTDRLPVIELFDNRIAAELRLWDAIDQHRLCPFVYYGIHDGMDLRELPWRRGQGYDIAALESLFTHDASWANQVISQLAQRVDDIHKIRALGFCVSIAHAQFMAQAFADAGISAVAVWGDSPDEVRRAALSSLATGKVNVVFSVDLFNEGIDVPLIDTLLLLRPTDSPTLFLQQLGRGLRKSHNKTVCTVLDFVGQHRKEFRFDRRFQALLGVSRKQLVDQIKTGFPFLPAGCHMELDPVASEIVLRNIRESLASSWGAKADELRRLAQAGARPSLKRFLEETGLALEDIYDGDRTWTDLQAAAGLAPQPADSIEASLRRACGRMLHIDDMVRIAAYRDALSAESFPPPRTERARRLMRMLVTSLLPAHLTKENASLEEGAAHIWSRPSVRAELAELFEVLEERIDHLQAPLDGRPDVPLQVHARYTRIEILAAFGIGEGARAASWREGVRWVEEERADLLAFTLDKTSGSFSPTTRYRDYAISPELIHWESQSTTRAESNTGRRYQRHKEQGSSIMLFARLSTDDRAFWFLGSADYVKHESDQPLAVTWRLHHRLPADLFAKFAAAVA